MADAAVALEQRKSVGGDDLVDVLLPEAQAGLLAALGAELGGFEEDDDEAVEGVGSQKKAGARIERTSATWQARTWRNGGAVSQPLVVHREALEQVFLEDGGSPATELDAARRAHAVADGEDGLEVVERDRAADFAVTLDLNRQGFLDSCRLRQLPVLGGTGAGNESAENPVEKGREEGGRGGFGFGGAGRDLSLQGEEFWELALGGEWRDRDFDFHQAIRFERLAAGGCPGRGLENFGETFFGSEVGEEAAGEDDVLRQEDSSLALPRWHSSTMMRSKKSGANSL